MLREIGGYFELELNQGREYYPDLIALNSARNALVYLLKSKKIAAINMPYFNCHVVADAVKRFCPNTIMHYYHVDEQFKPILDDVTCDGPLYYVNYYGLQDHVVRSLSNYYLIIDNSQAFYSQPIPDGDTIYCPRKFFGVCDGGYLKSGATLDGSLLHDTSWERAGYLLKRIDNGAAAAYSDYQAADAALSSKPLAKMSHLTQKILSNVDYESVKKKRRYNFKYLHRHLGAKNGLLSLIKSASKENAFVPFCYPYMTDDAEDLQERLIREKIYVPTYWPELKESWDLNEYEKRFICKIVCLPIDQRYDEKDMAYIINIVNGFKK